MSDEPKCSCRDDGVPWHNDPACPVKASELAEATGSVTMSLKEAKLIVLQVEILSQAFKFYMPSSVTKLKAQIESPNGPR